MWIHRPGRRANALVALLAACLSWVGPTRADMQSGTSPGDDDRWVVAGTEVGFTATGAIVSTGAVSIGVEVASVGRGVGGVSVTAGPVRRTRGEARRSIGGGVSEWWRPAARGLEHGLDLARRPPGGGRLRIDLRVSGATTRSGSEGIIFEDGDGHPVGSYSHLAVMDERGARLPARMHAHGDGVRIEVDDGDAQYPIQVDPLVLLEEAVLVPAAWRSYAERASAISGDGGRVIVGNGRQAWTFVRAGAAWAEEASLVPAFTGTMAATALDLDETGAIAVLGIFGEDTATGTASGGARVFDRAGASWSESAVLRAPDGSANDMFGFAVSLASDGTRVVVGAIRDDTTRGIDAGTVHVFRRSAGGWVHEARLEPTAARTLRNFGVSVDLDDGGTRCVVGATEDVGTLPGGAFVFSRSGTTWTMEGELTPPGGPGLRFGAAAAISGDSSRALVGSGDDTPPARTAHVFRREGSTWVHEAALTTAATGDSFGASAALDRTGNIAVMARSHWMRGNTLAMFSRAGTAWSEEGTLPVTDGYGGNVDMDASATRVVVARPEGGGTVYTTEAAGTACVTATECRTGHCVDGVCCQEPCGGGALDCEACSMAQGGTRDGLCRPLTATVARATVCRAAMDPCDLAETCDVTGRACPADLASAEGTVCRVSSGVCDLPETCPRSRVCPPDRLAAAGTTCRAPAGVCDVMEACTGSAADCPSDQYLPAGSVCRAPMGQCDAEESCSGAGTECPADEVLPDGASCTDEDVCNGAESCTAGVCRAGAPLDCDDGDPCTIDACDWGTGCHHELGACGDAWGVGPDVSAPDASAPAPDSGTPTEVDGGGMDAGGVPSVSPGCGCRAAGGPSGDRWTGIDLGGLALGLALAVRRRRVLE